MLDFLPRAAIDDSVGVAQRINSAFHRSRSLGRSASGPEQSDPKHSRLANGGAAGMRGHAELPPLSRGPTTGFPLDRGADMLMPQLVRGQPQHVHNRRPSSVHPDTHSAWVPSLVGMHHDAGPRRPRFPLGIVAKCKHLRNRGKAVIRDVSGADGRV